MIYSVYPSFQTENSSVIRLTLLSGHSVDIALYSLYGEGQFFCVSDSDSAILQVHNRVKESYRQEQELVERKDGPWHEFQTEWKITKK